LLFIYSMSFPGGGTPWPSSPDLMRVALALAALTQPQQPPPPPQLPPSTPPFYPVYPAAAAYLSPPPQYTVNPAYAPTPSPYPCPPYGFPQGTLPPLTPGVVRATSAPATQPLCYPAPQGPPMAPPGAASATSAIAVAPAPGGAERCVCNQPPLHVQGQQMRPVCPAHPAPRPVRMVESSSQVTPRAEPVVPPLDLQTVLAAVRAEFSAQQPAGPSVATVTPAKPPAKPPAAQEPLPSSASWAEREIYRVLRQPPTFPLPPDLASISLGDIH